MSKRTPLPNLAHPSNDYIPLALRKGSQHAHAAEYHNVFDGTTTSSHDDGETGMAGDAKGSKTKKQRERTVVVKLLSWFDGVKTGRGMPWRKELDPSTLDEPARGQRGYEVGNISFCKTRRNSNS